MQWRNPRTRWVLKDPMHLDRIQPLLAEYPDAKFVWPHRDPVRALASLVSIIGTIHWGRSDHPFNGASLDYMTDPNISAARFGAVIDQIESGAVPGSTSARRMWSSGPAPCCAPTSATSTSPTSRGYSP